MQLHGWEAILFWILAFTTLVMSIFVVTARLAVHSALFLISTLLNIALMFILLRAEFVAGVQILVYVGGVMVLFLFVIMLVQTKAEEESRIKLYTGQATVAVIVVAMLAISFIVALLPAQPIFRAQGSAVVPVAEQTVEKTETGTGSLSKDTQNVGEALYRQAALPFEIASLVLLVAIIGAVLLARGAKQEKLYE
jgi:NADH-quinone oxidoreductase subunit J